MLIPYENFFIGNLDPMKNFISALTILEKGWKLGSYPEISIVDPIDWTLENESYRSWNFHIHSLDMIDRILLGYNDHPFQLLLKPAINIVLDWIHNNLSTDGSPLTNKSPYAWYDMAVGLRAYRIAFVFDAAVRDNLLGDYEKKVIWTAIEAHKKYLSVEANIAYHSNHGYYQAAGQLALGRRFQNIDIEMSKTYSQGLERFKSMLDQQFTKDGVHKEHSPDYHRMVYSTLRGVLNSGLVEDDDILQFSKTIERALSWFIFPNQTVVNFGDSDSRSVKTSLTRIKNSWNTQEMRFVASDGELGDLGDKKVKFFSDAGYAVVRSPKLNTSTYHDSSYLAINGAFHSRTHKHADDLSLVWFDRGTNILIDAGRFGYIDKTEMGSNLWKEGYWYAHPNRIYCESTRSHNTLEFDGKNYLRKGRTPYGSAIKEVIESSSGLISIQADVQVFNTIKMERVLIFLPGEWLIVYDWFRDYSLQEHSVKQWFNFDRDVNVTRVGNGFLADIFDKERQMNKLSIIPFFNCVTSDVIKGQVEPELQGWSSLSEQEFSPSPSLNFELKEVVDGVFATLFSFSDDVSLKNKAIKPNIVNSSGRKARLSWVTSQGVHEVLLDKENSLAVDYNFSEKLNAEEVE